MVDIRYNWFRLGDQISATHANILHISTCPSIYLVFFRCRSFLLDINDSGPQWSKQKG